MKTLLYTHAYPPMRYPRSIQISRLVKYLNCPVDVVCCNEVNQLPDSSLEGKFVSNPGKIFRYDHKPPVLPLMRKVLNFCTIPDALLGWSLKTAYKLTKIAINNKYDALVTFGQPMSNHLAGLYLKKRLKVPWMAHFSDPWADNPYHGSNYFRKLINKFFEGLVVSSADMLVFTSNQTLDLVMEKYKAEIRCKAKVLPHAFDSELYPLQDSSKNELIIRHLGNFYPPRSPVKFIEAIKILQQRSPELLDKVRVEFIGEVSSRIRLEDMLRDLPSNLISFLPSVNYLESLRLMKEANLLLVIDAPFSTNVFMPSKLIDYFGAGVPIFAMTPSGTTAELVIEYGCEVASVLDVEDVATKLSAEIKLFQQEIKPIKLNHQFRNKYKAEEIAKRFEKLLCEMVSAEHSLIK